jgi:hypothetical protein
MSAAAAGASKRVVQSNDRSKYDEFTPIIFPPRRTGPPEAPGQIPASFELVVWVG